MKLHFGSNRVVFQCLATVAGEGKGDSPPRSHHELNQAERGGRPSPTARRERLMIRVQVDGRYLLLEKYRAVSGAVLLDGFSRTGPFDGKAIVAGNKIAEPVFFRGDGDFDVEP